MTEVVADDTYIEGQLLSVAHQGNVCIVELSMICPICKSLATKEWEVDASLKDKLQKLVGRNIRIVHAGEQWAVVQVKAASSL